MLHLDLGIFPWLYEAMLKDAEKLDLALATLSTAVQQPSDSFVRVFQENRRLQEAWIELVEQQQDISNVQRHLYFVMLHCRDEDQGAMSTVSMGTAKRVSKETPGRDCYSAMVVINCFRGEWSTCVLLRDSTRQALHRAAGIPLWCLHRQPRPQGTAADHY